MTGSAGADAAIAGHPVPVALAPGSFKPRRRRGSCTQIPTSVAGLIEACEQPPVLFFDRKPRCPEAQCFKKLDRDWLRLKVLPVFRLAGRRRWVCLRQGHEPP
jgi:hypothetical protein